MTVERRFGGTLQNCGFGGGAIELRCGGGLVVTGFRGVAVGGSGSGRDEEDAEAAAELLL